MYKLATAALLTLGAAIFLVGTVASGEEGRNDRRSENLLERLQELRAEHRELAESRNEEGRRRVEDEIAEVEGALERLVDREEGEQRERRSRRTSRHERRERSVEFEEALHRIEHLRRAAESLNRAGAHEMAREVAHEADNAERELERERDRGEREAEHPHEAENPHALLGAIHQLQEEVRALRHEIRGIRELLEERGRRRRDDDDDDDDDDNDDDDDDDEDEDDEDDDEDDEDEEQ